MSVSIPIEQETEKEVEQNKNDQQLEESFDSIVPTLIAIGDSPVADVEIQRHIVRALDNLSTEGNKQNKKVLNNHIYSYY